MIRSSTPRLAGLPMFPMITGSTGLVVLLALPATAQDPVPNPGLDGRPTTPEPPAPEAQEPEEPRGLRLSDPRAWEGYTIVAPINSNDVHLVDMDGEIVHTWKTAYAPGAWVYLLENGNILRCGRKDVERRFRGGGIGGVLQEIAWDGQVVWEWELASDEEMLHHEIDPLPNGNVLVIAWEARSREEALARGRDERFALEEGLWPDVIHEIERLPDDGAEIVWTWRAWDHLVQDRDPEKPGYGKLADHPGRIDINADHRYRKQQESDEERARREAIEAQMKAVGYAGDDDDPDHAADAGDPAAPPAGGPPPSGPEHSGDWLHTNSVDYLPGEDLIVLSSPHLCEIFVIDHSTTTAEAASNSGGRRGHGGELLWRWGNPQNYGRGDEADRRLFYQHDPTWLGGVGPREPRLLVFNNGRERPGGEHSTVEELVLPLDGERFARASGEAFGPAAPVWTYTAGEAYSSPFISGAQRLPNGNTLICAGAPGRVYEVTREGTIVWDYLNPLGGEVESSPRGGKAPPKALFRAVRVAKDHPGLVGKL